MGDWEFQVVTGSGQYKTVRVEGYNTYNDAAAAALSMTGGKRIATWNNVAPIDNSSEVVEVHHYYEEPEENDDEEFYQSLDEQEMEMYDLMCQLAMEKGEELPTISEFYEWLDS